MTHAFSDSLQLLSRQRDSVEVETPREVKDAAVGGDDVKVTPHVAPGNSNQQPPFCERGTACVSPNLRLDMHAKLQPFPIEICLLYLWHFGAILEHSQFQGTGSSDSATPVPHMVGYECKTPRMVVVLFSAHRRSGTRRSARRHLGSKSSCPTPCPERSRWCCRTSTRTASTPPPEVSRAQFSDPQIDDGSREISALLFVISKDDWFLSKSEQTGQKQLSISLCQCVCLFGIGRLEQKREVVL